MGEIPKALIGENKIEVQDTPKPTLTNLQGSWHQGSPASQPLDKKYQRKLEGFSLASTTDDY